jgi:exopolysaccharide biosynthesis polyprenyl glycosylphosphotransferase
VSASASTFVRIRYPNPARGNRQPDGGRPAHRNHRLHVIGENIFHGIVIRERKRADRSNQPFVIVMLEMPDEGRTNWRHAVEALAAIKRGTDVLGWLERDRVLGLILPRTDVSNREACRALEACVRAELAKRIDTPALARASIGVHAHGTQPNPAGSGAAPVDQLLDALRPRTTRLLAAAAAKRALDIAGGLALLIVLSPLLLVLAALVKLTSPGPVFFRQERVGEGAKRFTMLKFRTMRVNSDDRIHREYVSSLIAARQAGGEAAEGVFKITNDPRVTSIGRILRKTSLDELPQFLNVLHGEMSLVGPRPPIPYEVEQYKPWHHRRVLDAKPGITGLWQVTGRSRTTFDEMVRLDLRYAKKCSVWTDIKILLATPRAVVSGKGAC